ncbi:phosphatase PAP2 family protein [Allokutzneria sp. A3M-2-11 16]|uniref:phosphatase PAP2 family protein n=1 Tax=Allokutzneria sp. A3M-2-11 16 TaxID=2962043 RepID=UPI0020B64C04|nr:phosphatase PAP2 family protein [Allokutzneria sp. A3M-2-11 16]MCP3801269.1 phosphatase PAP2 family protein [Allokutzneria sp. A3M-2-11 16]
MATSDEAQPRTWPLPVAGAFGALIALGVTFLAYVHTVTGQRAENGAVHQAQTGGLADPAFSFLLKGGMGTVLLGAVAVFTLGVGVFRARFVGAVTVVGVIGGSTLLTELLKDGLLERPDLYATSVAGHNSFPSGHVTGAMAVLVALALVSPHRVRPFVLGGGSVLVAAVAVATVGLGWHRASDTLGGCLVAAMVGCLVAAFAGRGRRHPHPAWFVGALVVPSIVPIAGRVLLGSAASAAERLDTSITLAAVGAPVTALALVALLHGTELARRAPESAGGRHHATHRCETLVRQHV